MKIKRQKRKNISKKQDELTDEQSVNELEQSQQTCEINIGNQQQKSQHEDSIHSNKRHQKSVSDAPVMKKKRVSPSTAVPGKSIISTKKNDKKRLLGSDSKFKRKTIKKKSVCTSLDISQNCDEKSGTAQVELEASSNAAHKLDGGNVNEVLDIGEKKRIRKNGGKDLKKVNGREELQVTRKVKEKLLNMTRKERKIYIQELRRKHKPNFDLALRCKHLWEKLRRGKTSESERKKLSAEIYDIMKGKVKELIFAHDTCRIVECLVTNGGKDIRTALFEELVPELIHMSKSKYARFFVTKMLKYGSSAQRQLIFDAFRGHCVSLFRTSISAVVLETAYNDYANALQRYNIIIEFYGAEFAYFKAADNTVRTLKEIIADDPNRKSSIISYLGKILNDVVKKSQINLSLAHRLLSDYFELADCNQLEELVDSLKLRIPEILHTNDGVRTAMKCLWNSSAKDRKIILKNFKGLVVKTCTEKFAHRFLIAVFDSVDDTVLIGKCLLKEILSNIGEIIITSYGVRVIHHLIHPRDPRFCSASQIEIYEAGDGNSNSRKDPKLRYSELFAYVRKPLCVYFAQNMDFLLSNHHASLLVLDMLEAPTDLDKFDRSIDEEDRAACYEAIALACSREFIPSDSEQLHPIEHPHAHFTISKLLKSDLKFNVKLGDFIVKHCGNQISSWVSCNKGCFVLLHMLENASHEIRDFLIKALPLSAVQRYHTKGATILMQKLEM
ncbi:unnamed protein product [Thelazia callipaeda]|uniref:PUM-HD domain-containing protein n=1 Tax=Thelazia callipaeda TaxID=103827 RepID=A0A0N5CW76_THECL|nr:unnamed protein product [Thelazia callipaeda]